MIPDEVNVLALPASEARTQSVSQCLPTEAVSPKHDMLAVNVAIGNHRYPCWIAKSSNTLKAFVSRLSASYNVTYSIGLKPGVTNLLIDEFSVVEMIGFLRGSKRPIRARNS